MDEFSTAPVDVREMLCAQALAIVARAINEAPPGTPLRVLVGTEDVRQDLLAWATDRGYTIDARPRELTLTRR